MTDPLYSAIAVADIEHFGSRSDTAQGRLRTDLFAVLAAALHAQDIDWARVDRKETGDGAIMRIPPSVSKTRITRALSWHLHQALVERTLSDEPVEELRLRIALHGGEVNDDEFGAYGTDLNTACRLVDAQPLRDVLTAARRSHVALIVSAAWYRAVVRHGHARIEPSAYAPVHLRIKELRETAWIHVPGLSTPPGLAEHEAVGQAAEAAGGDPADFAEPAGSRSVVIHGGKVRDIVQGDKRKTVYGEVPGQRGSR